MGDLHGNPKLLIHLLVVHLISDSIEPRSIFLHSPSDMNKEEAQIEFEAHEALRKLKTEEIARTPTQGHAKYFYIASGMAIIMIFSLMTMAIYNPFPAGAQTYFIIFVNVFITGAIIQMESTRINRRMDAIIELLNMRKEDTEE